AIAAFPAAAATVTMFAFRTASPGSDPAGQDVDADNRLRAYAAAGQRIDGWMAFDVSEVLAPGSAVIVTGARLTLYAEGNAAGSALQSVAGLPSVGVWYSNHDGWERGGSGFPTAPDARISGPGHTGPFSSESRTALDIDLL